jgi:hypothetical protein
VKNYKNIYLVNTNDCTLSEKAENEIIKGSLKLFLIDMTAEFVQDNGNVHRLLPETIFECRDMVYIEEGANQYVFSTEIPCEVI